MNPENISSPNAKQAAIAEMVGSIQSGKSRYFFVGVVGYSIEGYPSPSSGLSVDPRGTSDMRLIVSGYSCRALFSPELFRPEIVSFNGVVPITVDSQVRHYVPVQLEVKYAPGGRRSFN